MRERGTERPDPTGSTAPCDETSPAVGTSATTPADGGEGLLCPHCKEPLSLDVAASVKAKHRLAMVLHPKEDTLLSAETVGGTLVQLSKMLKACAKSLSVKNDVMVERITTDEDGAIKMEVLIVNGPASIRP